MPPLPTGCNGHVFIIVLVRAPIVYVSVVVGWARRRRRHR